VPNLSFVASSTVALDRRVGVALVDVDPETLLLDPARVEEAIIPGKTRAIMAVHLFGQTADMAALRDIARRHSLALIEDAAQAHGAVHELGHAGALGDAAGFSFQSYKNLSAGEGGAFTTNDAQVFERAYAFHNVGRARVGGQRWSHDSIGWNCRATEYVAAVLLHRLKNLEAEQAKRWTLFQALRGMLKEVACVEPLGLAPGMQRHGVHMFGLRYRPELCAGLDLDDFLKAVRAEGIPVDRLYNGMTQAQQPAFQRLRERHPDYLRVLSTPVSDAAVRDLIYLPHHLFLSDEQGMADIAGAFAKVQAHFAPSARPMPRVERSQPAAHAPQATHTPAAPARSEAKEQPIRVGIIGVGMMGRQHAAVISRIPTLKLAAVADARAEAAQSVGGEFGCRAFPTPEALLRSGEIDAVVIATPHWQHAELAVSAFQAGLHVICEKPLSVTVEQADEVLHAARNARGLFLSVYQNRFEPCYLHAKQLLESGELGAPYRCEIVETQWRTEAYYQNSPWRGTWKGEGGGVLLNQAPHVLDRYAWLCGMPSSLLAHCSTRLHRIEVEDTATAMLTHENGLQGHLHVSTAENPPTSRTVICCDRGRIAIENGRLHVTRLKESLQERTATETREWAAMESETREVHLSHLGSLDALLAAYYDNFAAAVAGTAAVLCPGSEGRNSVELANAIILSSARGASVSLPLDRAEYTRFIEKRIAQGSGAVETERRLAA
jgi:predicted dehydrogenase/dTDP-4-amino-4,6-dideoxygalactose transaminase